MPEPLLSTQDFDEEIAVDPASISTDPAGGRQPSDIDAVDEKLSDIDDDLAELEALLAGPTSSESSPGKPNGPSATRGGQRGANGKSVLNASRSGTQGARQGGSLHTSGNRGIQDEDGIDALSASDLDHPSPWDEVCSTATETPSHSDSGPEPAPFTGEAAKWSGAPARATRFACRAGMQVLTFLCAVVDRPFRRLSIRTKTLLGYVAWATLFVSAGTWFYALLIA